MAIKKIERFITKSDGAIDIGGIPIYNSDIGDISNDMMDMRAAIAGMYGKTTRYIQGKYDLSFYTKIGGTGTNAPFRSLAVNFNNQLSVDYTITNGGVTTARNYYTGYQSYTNNLRDFETVSGLDIDLSYASDIVSITINKGCFGFKGELYFMDTSQTFTFDLTDLSINSFRYICFDTQTMTLTNEVRNRKYTTPIPVREIKETTISVKNPVNGGNISDPSYIPAVDTVTNIPLVGWRQLVTGSDISYNCVVYLEDCRQSNEVLFLRNELRAEGYIDENTLR